MDRDEHVKKKNKITAYITVRAVFARNTGGGEVEVVFYRLRNFIRRYGMRKDEVVFFVFFIVLLLFPVVAAKSQ